jgi:hypothetical protein
MEVMELMYNLTAELAVQENVERKVDAYGIPLEIEPKDAGINEIISALFALSAEKRQKFQHLIRRETGKGLFDFGINMALYAMRSASQEHFTNGLRALGLSLEVMYADSIMNSFVLYWDVHKKHGLTFDTALRDGGESAQLLEDFLKKYAGKTFDDVRYALFQERNTTPPMRELRERRREWLAKLLTSDGTMSESGEYVLSIAAFVFAGSYPKESGNETEERLLQYFQPVLPTERQGVVEVLSKWIDMGDVSASMYSVHLAGILGITEMIPKILKLKCAVERGKVFRKYYIDSINMALDKLQPKDM